MKKHLLVFLSLIGMAKMNSQSYYMCNSNGSSASSGTLYDSGGPSNYYQSDEDCTFLISSNCPTNITLVFNSFSTEQGYDYLTVYNGNNTSAPVLGSYWGTGQVPTMVATSGQMLVEWHSDGSGEYPGFSASWSFGSANCAPVANFNSVINVCQGKVNFTDATTNSPTTWLWNFGDGGASNLQNPSHTYTLGGVYSVALVASNSYGNSTITKTVSVNPITFNIGYNGLPIANSAMSFTTDSFNGQVYTWNFGDGGLAGTANAIHTYSAQGSYVVSLTIASGSCVTTTTMQVLINGTLGVEQFYIPSYNASILPNPFEGTTQLNLQLAETSKIRIDVVNQLGQLMQVVSDSQLKAGQYNFELNEIPAGVYYVRISEGSNSRVLKVVSLR